MIDNYGTTMPSARRCRDGLVHYVSFTRRKGWTEGGQWFRVCDPNDDDVYPVTLGLGRGDVTCVACVAKEPEEVRDVETA